MISEKSYWCNSTCDIVLVAMATQEVPLYISCYNCCVNKLWSSSTWRVWSGGVLNGLRTFQKHKLAAKDTNWLPKTQIGGPCLYQGFTMSCAPLCQNTALAVHYQHSRGSRVGNGNTVLWLILAARGAGRRVSECMQHTQCLPPHLQHCNGYSLSPTARRARRWGVSVLRMPRWGRRERS